MRLFLSAIEVSGYAEGMLDEMERRGIRMLWNLMSYFYLRKKPKGFAEVVIFNVFTKRIIGWAKSLS